MPVASAPMRSPATTFPKLPGSTIRMPKSPFAEITLPAPGVVPPTPITWGELAGLSTPRRLLQSRLPLSPEAANHDCPIAFAFAKMLSSARCVAADTPTSHTPQLVETTWPGLSVTIRLYRVVKSASEVEAAM